MTQIERLAKFGERLAGTKHAANSEHILNVLRGKEPLRHGMSVEVDRANKRTAPNGAEYHVRIKASTESIARDSGIIPVRAWEKGGLKNFAENPVILAYHDHKQPIGRSVHTELTDSALVEYWEFHGESDISRLMQTLYERGFMRAASVGFLVHEYRFIDELDDKELEKLVQQYGAAAVRDIYWIAEKAELLETSAVPVPSDAKALEFSFAARSAEAVGIDVSALRSTIEDSPMSDKETPEQIAAREADEAKNKQPTLRELADAIAALAVTIKELGAEFKKSASAVVTPPAGTSISDAVATTETARNTEPVEVTIEKRDGESDEQALNRTVDAMVAKLRGAPVPSEQK